MTVVADVVAAFLDRHCAGPVFGVLGEGTLAVVDRLVNRHDRRYVAAAREDGAVAMADAHARVTGQLSLAAVTHGPGLTNTATALTEAARARTPMVLLAGDTPVDADDNPQRLDQAALVAPTGALFCPIRTASGASDDVRSALRRAHTARLPVVLDLDTSLLLEPATLSDLDLGLVESSPIAPTSESVASVATAVAAVVAPVIVAGRGAIAARDDVVALADHLDAGLATTLMAKGCFTGHPRDLGVSGGFATAAGHRALAATDLVLALGASMNRFTRDDGRLFATSTVVQVDSAADQLRDGVDIAVHADVSSFCRAMLDTAPPRRGMRSMFSPTDESAHPPRPSESSGADLREIVDRLDQLFPTDRTVVVDGGHAALSEPSRRMRVPRPDGFVFPLHFGSIGLSLGSAIGAAIARPDRPTICFAGDGGFLMSLAELDTVARERPSLTVVVMNDSAYGWEYHQMRAAGIDATLSRFERPSFAAIADGFGIESATIVDPAELDDLAGRFARPRAPLVLDVVLDPEVRTDWYEHHAAPAVAMHDADRLARDPLPECANHL